MTKSLVTIWTLTLAAAMPLMADTWTDPDTGYTWTYRINGDTAEIYKGTYSAAISPSPTEAVTIPPMLGGKSVTSIGDYAFYCCGGLTGVVIPDSVESIGFSAFSSCNGLAEVTIPDNVMEIWPDAFKHCSGLTSVTIGNSVTNISYSAFESCEKLNAVYVDDLITWLGISFSGENANPVLCAHNLYVAGKLLRRLDIPDGVTRINDYAFCGCNTLIEVRIPKGVTSIGRSAFSYCDVLSSITIPNSVTSIEDNAFSCCSCLTSINIPNGVTSLGNGAFDYCSGLTSLTIPSSVTNIGTAAFRECSGLTDVTMSNGVTKIGAYSFYRCTRLTDMLITDTVIGIGEYAFCRCTSLTNLIIGAGVNDIGDYAFSDCHALKMITIGKGVRSVGDYAFRGCYGITRLTLPNAVMSIGKYAFSGCSGLRALTIPNSMRWIGHGAFRSCNSLENVYIDDVAAWCGIRFETDNSNPLSFANHLYVGDNEVLCLVVPDGVKQIGDFAFVNCTGLRNVILPSSVENIGYRAFAGCTGLKLVYFLGDAPETDGEIFKDAAMDLMAKVTVGSVGWESPTSSILPEAWPVNDEEDNARSISYGTPAWIPAGVVVDVGGGKSVTMPETWLTEKTSRAVTELAANGRRVWECYVLGLDPESTTNDVKITSFPMKADGTPDVANIVFDPPEAKRNVEGAWPVVKGTASLGGEWQAVTEENKAGFRFFKVEVMLP